MTTHTARYGATLRKANRLIETGAIIEHHNVRTFTVDGDHDTYIVSATPVGSGWGMRCTCPSNDPACSHAIAVRKTITMSTPDPVDPFDGLVE